ncbi:MAG: SAM-dependent methyltransferase [Betaproteobacteria bacterium]|nr:SAM-dependent methyltransferase [Betaproteobacteria bacterium]
MNHRPPLLAVATLSAAALGYEILLLRLFAIVQWHHFAYLAISVALLGFGAAGTFVTLARHRLVALFPWSFSIAAAAFAVAAVGCFAAAERVPFNALEIAWDPAQFLGLAAIYLLLFVPFFCAATALCVAYAAFGAHVARLYGADIIGAGLGSLGLLALLYALHPADALRAILAFGFAAAALAAWPAARRGAIVLGLAALLAPWLLPPSALELVASDYKDLRQALRVDGARSIAQRVSPLGVVIAVDSPRVPLRHAPGLSLNATAGPPPQIGLFVDGQAAGAVTRFDGDTTPLRYLADMTSAVPYRLLQRPRVLVLGAGAGGDILQALVHGASRVDAVELDAQIVAVLRQDLTGFSGRPYDAPGVRLHVAEARGFVAASRDHYDLIQVALLDAFGSSAAGLGSLHESHLYTVEALDGYLDRLAPGGLLAFTRWVSLPPRDSLRLFATAIAALERRGAPEPAMALAMIRGWSTTTLLVKNGPFAASEIAAIREFCRQRSFDTVYLPGIAAAEANVFNVLETDDFFAATQALLGPERQAFLDRYKFDLTPTGDDRPYFFHFFKWHTLPELLRLRAQGALPPMDWGYPVLVVALLQAIAVSVALILLPLALGRSRHAFAAVPTALRRRVPVYFLALGLGFMAIEIPFLQRFTLFLSHPAHAAAVVLAAFLIFAGLGARHSARWTTAGARWPFAAIAAIALIYAAALPALLGALMGLALGWKILVTIGLIAPLAFCLGMPFPLGLAAVAARAEALVPWAWAINGFASVVATLLATLLAIHWGQTVVVLIAVAFYALAAWQIPRG